MTTRIIPWYLPQDYEAIKRLMLDDPNIPNTYDEWFNLATNRITELASKGITVKKVVINSDEFSDYCRRAGLDCNHFTIGAYASAKA